MNAQLLTAFLNGPCGHYLPSADAINVRVLILHNGAHFTSVRLSITHVEAESHYDID